MQTRRDFLKKAAMLSGGVGLLGAVPESVQRAFAIEATPGSTYLDAEHVVILMQENRSFDHVFGTLQGVRGFNDPRAMRLPNQNSVFVQTDAAGNSYAPWRLNINDTNATWMGSIPHSRESQVDAWNDGHNNGWLDAKRSHKPAYRDMPLTMGHYTREDLPFYYALADAFTVCDQHYCGAMTSTSPNRSLFWTGTVREQQNANSRVFMRNPLIESCGMTWKTFPERLHEAGIEWKFYQNEVSITTWAANEQDQWLGNFGCNPLEYFANYNIQAGRTAEIKLKSMVADLTGEADDLQKELRHARPGSPSALELKTRLAGKKEQIATLIASMRSSGAAGFAALSPSQQALHRAAFTTNSGDPTYSSLETIQFEDNGKRLEMKVPKGDILHQFREDVNNGTLPKVSWLASPEKFSDHPTSPWYGAWYVSEVMDILTKNPEVWKKTIFILTYDENDGYFDHAPSFVAADPKRPETGRASAGLDTGLEYMYASDDVRQGIPSSEARTGPIGLGFRVPMVIASPWTRGGWVNSQLFEHTSTLIFLEDFIQKKYNKQIIETNISPWRRSIVGDLTSVFRPYEAGTTPLPFLNRDRAVTNVQKARYKELPSNYKKLTTQQIATLNKKQKKSQLMSQQESGTRPSSALPYELYADGSISSDRKFFRLQMTADNKVHGAKSIGAPFNAYLHHTPKPVAATYTVKAGDTLVESFPLIDGHYSIDIHGPNGFFRSFNGSATAPTVFATYERKGSTLSGNLKLNLQNPTAQLLTIEVRDNAYGAATTTHPLKPGDEPSIIIDLSKSHSWYDITIKTVGSSSETRLAGRVETGRPGITDPAMGNPA